jgi:hypothetical protein
MTNKRLIARISPVSVVFIFVTVGTYVALIFQLWYMGIAVFAIATLLFSRLFFKGARYGFLGFSLLSIYLIYYFAYVYLSLGIESSTTEAIGLGECVYFSIVTWTTLGYGDFHPSIASRPFAAIEALFGYMYMSLLIAKLLSFMTSNANNNENH